VESTVVVAVGASSDLSRSSLMQLSVAELASCVNYLDDGF